ALERHDSGAARVIPVIVDPCDWKAAPFAKLAAFPKDGKPITKHPNQHDAFLEVVQAIRATAAPLKGNAGTQPTARQVGAAGGRVAKECRSSNLRVKKDFSDHDRDTFLENSYEYVANFFEGSLAELEVRNPGITGKLRRINANHFTAEIYKNGTSV